MSFFSKNEADIKSFIRYLPSGEEYPNTRLLREYFNEISIDPELFEQNAKLIIEWKGRTFLSFVLGDVSSENIEAVLSFFGFVAHENYLRMGRTKSHAARELIELFDEHNENISIEKRRELSRTLRQLTLEIAKESYVAAEQKQKDTENSIQAAKTEIEKDLKLTLQNTEEEANQLSTKIEGWKEYLEAHQAKLNDVKSNYNFVGLSKGFHDIEGKKRQGRRWLLGFLIAMGAITVAVPIFSILDHLDLGTDAKTSWTLEDALKIGPLLFSIEIICIYYFRILLKNYSSMSAQIVQLELRQALCAFIQSYVEYKKELGDNVSIDKFEEMIFSGITMEPGQIPQTFDGLEKLAGALNALKPKSS
ncbi:hypothetical protein [Terasakiella pusilla]|uniref:hypothetical protein n=1 Tax=Terasakiella pusilla TaxID=64973 RepID=UPI003AA84768